MNSQALIDTTRMMVADGKRLLAMDESNPTCNKRFAKWGTPQNSTVGSVKPENAASMRRRRSHWRRQPACRSVSSYRPGPNQ